MEIQHYFDGLSKLKSKFQAKDIFGGLAAMLVALPSAIAFGLLVYAPLGPNAVAQGAIAGMVGTILIGTIVPLLGGAPRLVSVPSAPAATLLAALVVETVSWQAGHFDAALIPPLIMVVVFLAGILQLLFGVTGGGKLIKYIPYPVVAGYLSSVGILIILGQFPKFLGITNGTSLWYSMVTPDLWSRPALCVGIVTIVVMLLAPKVTQKLPASILGLIGGIITYIVLGLLVYPELLTLDNNKLVIGLLPAGMTNEVLLQNLMNQWQSIGTLISGNLRLVIVPAITLAVLLSIDTLKTCVILDTLTRSRHQSNRELIAQGVGNVTSGLFGGLAGSGMMGATLVNLTSGGCTRISGAYVGLFSLLAFIFLGNLIAWVPLSDLAGILIVVGVRMVDRHSFKLLLNRSTMFDFFVILAVVITAVTTDLITAAGVGLELAILLFLRDQIRGSVIYRQVRGNQVFSKRQRLPAEMAILETKGQRTEIFELQGVLFFGTTDQLFSKLSEPLSHAKYIILDLRRVRSVDFTVAHMLEQIEDQISDRGGWLICSDLPAALPTGQDLYTYFNDVGLVRPKSKLKIFSELGEAMEWAENQILAESGLGDLHNRPPFNIRDLDIFSGFTDELITFLEKCIEQQSYIEGDEIFSHSSTGDELFIIRKGVVRIMLSDVKSRPHHIASFGRGNFFGELAFLDAGIRSADAIASTSCDLYILSRKLFDELIANHPDIGEMIFVKIARTLSYRLRMTNAELSVLKE